MERYSFKDKEGIEVVYYKWKGEKGNIKAIIQIAHGMAEHALRYDYFANKLVDNGFIVYANDHRGHGETIVSTQQVGYIADNDGFNWKVNDMKELTDIIKKENENIPIIVMGHSMGSFLTQRYMQIYGDDINGVILSGTNGKPFIYTKLGIFVSKVELLLRGRRAKSKLMNQLSFGSFNSKFKPNRTDFDWLCSVEGEVDKYIDDDKCGFICSTSFYYDFIRGLWDIHKRENIDKIPKDKPIYIFSGKMDPVGNFGKGVISLYELYRSLGVKNVKCKLYDDGRHEMLNEGNKDEVIQDIIGWIDENIIL